VRDHGVDRGQYLIGDVLAPPVRWMSFLRRSVGCGRRPARPRHSRVPGSKVMPALPTTSCPVMTCPGAARRPFGNFPPTTYDKAIATLEAAGHGVPAGYINQSATAHPVTPRSVYSQRAVRTPARGTPCSVR
jgi:hypothetical protein